jgi:hypothetical protein
LEADFVFGVQAMSNWDMQIAQVQARVTHAVHSGEPESSPRVRQMVAELERLASLRMTGQRWTIQRDLSERENGQKN